MHVTLFYSNTSPNCKALLQTIKNLRFGFTLKFVNIDNERMKSLVLQKFSVVPTVVILDKDEISLYTGENAFDWFAQLNNDSEGSENDESVPRIDEERSGTTRSTKSLLEIATELAKERDNSQPSKNQKNEIDFKKNL